MDGEGGRGPGPDVDFDGDLVQIDYRDDGTIHTLHVADQRGRALVLTIYLPAEPMEPIRVGQPHAVFLDENRRPTVRVRVYSDYSLG